jgi:hypothetical protein
MIEITSLKTVIISSAIRNAEGKVIANNSAICFI